MKRKSAQLFDGDARQDDVQLTVNDDFARRLQVNTERDSFVWYWSMMWFHVSSHIAVLCDSSTLPTLYFAA